MLVESGNEDITSSEYLNSKGTNLFRTALRGRVRELRIRPTTCQSISHPQLTLPYAWSVTASPPAAKDSGCLLLVRLQSDQCGRRVERAPEGGGDDTITAFKGMYCALSHTVSSFRIIFIL